MFPVLREQGKYEKEVAENLLDSWSECWQSWIRDQSQQFDCVSYEPTRVRRVKGIWRQELLTDAWEKRKKVW